MHKKHKVRQYSGKAGKSGSTPDAPIDYTPAPGGGSTSKPMRSSKNRGSVATGGMKKHETRQSHMRKTMGNNGRY